MRKRVREAVLQHLGRQADLDGKGRRALYDYSGTVLYSRWGTLRQGPLYLMGLNPGGDPSEIRMSVLGSLDSDKCEYEEDWKRGPGHHPIQRVAKEIITALLGPGQVCEVFGTNAIFLRSRHAPDLPLGELWAGHWPVHQVLLSVVKPRVIVCLGNGENGSAFSLIRQKSAKPVTVDLCAPGESRAYRHGKSFRARLETGPGRVHECLVIGVPHPSRVPVLSPRLEHFLDRLRADEL